VRKKLWLLAIVLFIGGGIVGRISPKNAAVDFAASDNISATAYAVSTEPLFGDSSQKFVAHRGYSNGAPENSVPAFEFAGKSGFWGIETDIFESADGVFMCMHDDTIDRTTDGEGAIGDYTYSQLMEFNIDEGTNIDQYEDLKIPTMIEYLNTCVIYGCVPVIEIKGVTNYDAFLETIYNSGLENRCIVTGGMPDLLEIRARNTTIPLMPIGYSNKDYTYYLEQVSALSDNRGILYNYPVVTEDVVRILHEQGLYCGVWSLDTAEEAEKYLSYGVDYVVTNEIPGLNQMINENE
jgi:glycerophosphoryl diester phosphodiesterase